jgi:hypothetical protein
MRTTLLFGGESLALQSSRKTDEYVLAGRPQLRSGHELQDYSTVVIRGVYINDSFLFLFSQRHCSDNSTIHCFKVFVVCYRSSSSLTLMPCMFFHSLNQMY